MKRGVFGILIAAVLLWGGYVLQGRLLPLLFAPTEPTQEQLQGGTREEEVPEDDSIVIAENLEIPWELAFLPGGDILVTERTGRLVRIGQNQRVYEIEGVQHVGEGGLLGMALHPEFEQNQWVYLYFTTRVGEGLENRVERWRLEDDVLSERTVIFSGIPGARFHDGGRIAFGPDAMLYITTGDAGNGNLAQNIHSLAGKILRIQEDGSLPSDNPFDNAVHSFGHRNPQGIVWDEVGRLWSTEHGRSGPLSGFDELNLIEEGKNYGWPLIQGDERKTGLETPELHSGPSFTWAPGSVAHWDNSIFFGGLRGEALYEVPVDKAGFGDTKIHFFGEYGRIRTVRLGPDSMLYLTTSNRDGRGKPKAGDDKIIRINPRIFR